MSRWAFAGLSAAVFVQAALGQSLWPNGAKPAGAPATAARGADKRIVTMRTAGQPDRRVEILRTETLPDGTQFTELKDVASGAVYSIMGPPPGPDPFPTAPVATVETTPRPAPATEAVLPQARPRPADPLLGAQGPLGTKSTSVAAAASVGQPTGTAPKPSKVDVALFGGGMPTTQPTPKPRSVPASAPKQSAFAKAVFGEWPQPAPAAVPRINPTVVAAKPTPQSVPPREEVRPAPTVMAMAPKSVEPPRSPVMSAPPVYATPEKSSMTAIAPPTLEKPTVAIAAPTLVEKPAEVAASRPLVVSPPRVVEPAASVTQVSATVEEETTSLLHQLANHTLPSGRIAAARSLAELPTVSRAEVIQALVAAAESDSAGVVRGNCILVLNAMRYAHPEYVEMLRGWETSDEPAVRNAVRMALANIR
jgi:hypothetical protein